MVRKEALQLVRSIRLSTISHVVLATTLFMGTAAATTYTLEGTLRGVVNGESIPLDATLDGTADDGTGVYTITYRNLNPDLADGLRPYLHTVASFAFAKETGGAENWVSLGGSSPQRGLAYTRDCITCNDTLGQGPLLNLIFQRVEVKPTSTLNKFQVDVTMMIEDSQRSDEIVATRPYSELLRPVSPAASGTAEALYATTTRTVDTTGGRSHTQVWRTSIVWTGSDVGHPSPTALSFVPGQATFADGSLTVGATIAVSPIAQVPALDDFAVVMMGGVLLLLGALWIRQRRKK
jgi:hypothetical protein